MGGSSAPKNTTSTTKTELPPWLNTAYTDFLGQTNAANAKPYQSYQGQLNAGLSSGQNQALHTAQAGAAGQLPGTYSQSGALTNVLNGLYNVPVNRNAYQGATTNVGTNPYAGQNQYLNQMVNDSNQNITDQYNQNAVPALAAQFAQGGAFGGSAMQQAGQASQDTLAKNLAQSTNSLRFNDYTTQQGLAENALNRSVQAQQTDLARNSALDQQYFQNNLQSAGQSVQNFLGASSALNGQQALQSQWNSQLAGMGQVQQDFAQGNIDQNYNDWYQQNYGYDQQRLNNYGNALNSVAGNFQGSSTSGTNPAYKPRTAGGAAAAVGGGALAGAATGATIGAAGGPIGAGAGALIGGGLAAMGYYL